MLRGWLATGAIVAAGLEPVVAGDFDLARYAITQGGLLAVVLVLLWYIREMHKVQLGDEKERSADARRANESLISLVGQANVTMQKNISVGEAQEKAIDRLARALEGR